MRKTFGHLLPPTDAEIAEIWKSGLLTVDANVLLDLYRYRPVTRDALLAALNDFRGRLWLTHQAASEFMRNRLVVSATVGDDFEEARKAALALEKQLRTTVDQLRSRRAVPRELSESLESQVSVAVRDAKAAVAQAREAHEAFVASDPVLVHILDLFNDRIGAPPSEDEMKELRAEGERRQKAKIPPGYADAAKEGDRPYGDYVLWQQVLERAKSAGAPVVLVTSDGKEDWWEKSHGRTLGPRQELLDEAHRVSDQRIVILRTESFLDRHAKFRGTPPPSIALADIRALAFTRSTSAPTRSTPEDLVREALENWAPRLTDTDDCITSTIAATNATEFDLDDVEVTDVGDFNFAEGTIPFRATLHFGGSQLEDRIFCGDGISAEISGEARFDGSEWEIDGYEISAEIDDYSE